MAKRSPNSQTETAEQDGSEVRHRIQFDFSEDAYQRLIDIKKRAKVSTSAQAVRNAMRLYEWYLIQLHKGAKLQLAQDGVVKEIELLF